LIETLIKVIIKFLQVETFCGIYNILISKKFFGNGGLWLLSLPKKREPE
jgi:hypothetical protein